ncbi:MAG: hypothetical protein JXB29_07945, partial [Sedimentisphaerales bacterium]|nr:hypothetical protein [Sedimentisphaerales bacterium]
TPSQAIEGSEEKIRPAATMRRHGGRDCISSWLATLLFVLIIMTAHQTACGSKFRAGEVCFSFVKVEGPYSICRNPLYVSSFLLESDFSILQKFSS